MGAVSAHERPEQHPRRTSGGGALGVLEARGARGQDDEAAHRRAYRPHGQEHRPGDLGCLRRGGLGRAAAEVRRRGLRVRARPGLHGARSRPRARGRRSRRRVPLGGRGGRNLHRGLPFRRRAAPDLHGLQARGRRALPPRQRGDVRPRPVFHRDGRRLRGGRAPGREPGRHRARLPRVDRARDGGTAGDPRCAGERRGFPRASRR